MTNWEPGEQDWWQSPWLRAAQPDPVKPSNRATISTLFVAVCFLGVAALLYFGRL